MSSPRSRLLLMAVMLSGIAMACTDTTSPVAPTVGRTVDPLPSLTWQSANGPRTATLLGSEMVLESGVRIPLDAAAASNFRRLAVAMPKMEALAKRMAPVWSKMGLPQPTSGPQARVALAALQARSTATSHLDGVLMLSAPIDAPTLVVECDPTMQFCGFDPGDEQGSGGFGGSSGGGQGGQNGPCERLGLMLYQAVGQWRAALGVYDLATRLVANCAQEYGLAAPTMCLAETALLAAAVAQLSFTTAEMQVVGQSMRALGCV